MASITETTSPATADCGMRVFSVVSDSGENEVQICVIRRENRSQPDEPIERVEVQDRVPENVEIARAMFPLASMLLERRGSAL